MGLSVPEEPGRGGLLVRQGRLFPPQPPPANGSFQNFPFKGTIGYNRCLL